MHGEDFFFRAFVYLAAAVASVPIASRLGLGSVLGYLVAGVAIGPFGLGLVGAEGTDVMHFAEFGVVMMLFLVGLELEPDRLWRMRVPIAGLGGLQVAVTAAALGGVAFAVGLSWQEAIAVGVVGAMSSTAIVLQSLAERGQMGSAAGRSSFAVLLFQDISVIPILAFLPLLATHAPAASAEEHAETWVHGLSPLATAGVVIATVAALVVAGRTLVRPVLRAVAATRLRELFSAAALLMVIGIALLFTRIGLSPALGTFVAGVVLAGSEYRHALESDLEPFKGLLLGLFFISVGASIDFAQVVAAPRAIAGIVFGTMAVKALVLFGLARLFGMGLDQSIVFGTGLSQVGEFAFVLLSFTVGAGILTEATAGPLVASTALTMALAPLLGRFVERVVLPRVGTKTAQTRAPDEIDEVNPVIVAGYGRFGQIVGRLLQAGGVGLTVLEYDADQVEMLRKFGHKVFYGDASRVDLLEAAGAASAKVIVIATDSPGPRLELVHTVREHFPHLTIVARAESRPDAYALIEAGAHHVIRETFDSSLSAGVATLRTLGVRAHRAVRLAQRFREHDEAFVREVAAMDREDSSFRDLVRGRIREVERVLRQDGAAPTGLDDDPWDTTTLRAEFGARRDDDGAGG
ncbi:MAG: cation:proton antiporter [Myxococcales bacterium]|nr:cation:proton antiporter [Myxococcales bacterium]